MIARLRRRRPSGTSRASCMRRAALRAVSWARGCDRVGRARGVKTDGAASTGRPMQLGARRRPGRGRRWCAWRGQSVMETRNNRWTCKTSETSLRTCASEVRKAVVGQDEVIELMLTSLLVGGHVLLEGVPGTAKTLLARSVRGRPALQFGRIQFTPDLMPGDMLGTNLFNFQTNSFVLTKGPIFTELLLADEINRTPPKTQAALLQAMQERAGHHRRQDHELGDGFMVIATQNPIEQEGTYPLPEAQLDRFLFKIVIGYPSRDEEREIVRAPRPPLRDARLEDFGLQPVRRSRGTLRELREAVARVTLPDALIDYIVDLVRATREHASLEVGASPRAATMLAAAARAYAVLQGRDFVIPDDVKTLALPALRHRVVLSPCAEIEGLTADRIIARNPRPDARRRDDPADTPRGPDLRAGHPAGAVRRHRRAELWPLSLAYGAAVLLRGVRRAAGASSAATSPSTVAVPDRLYIGDQRADHGTDDRGSLSPADPRRGAVRADAAISSRPRSVACHVAPGDEARFALPLVPRRRGSVNDRRHLAALERPARAGRNLAARARSIARSTSCPMSAACRAPRCSSSRKRRSSASRSSAERARAPSSRRCATMPRASTAASSTGSTRPAIASWCARSSNRAQPPDRHGVRHRLSDARAGRRAGAARPCDQCRADAGLGLAAERRPGRHLRLRRRGAALSRADPRGVELRPHPAAPTAELDYQLEETNFTLAWPSSMRGCGARWSSCSPISSTPSPPSC